MMVTDVSELIAIWGWILRSSCIGTGFEHQPRLWASTSAQARRLLLLIRLLVLLKTEGCRICRQADIEAKGHEGKSGMNG